MIDLTVAMCSIDTRYRTFALRMQDMLWGQHERLPLSHRRRVEILILTDNKVMTIGAKRNALVRAASGQYVSFVDDDDRIDDGYLSAVLEATETGCDVITFPAMVSLAGGPQRICHYSRRFEQDRNTPTGYNRMPNHICAVKRELMVKTPFADICMGEDADYAIRLRPKLTSEHEIERPLYFYDYDPRTSECRR